MLIQPLTDIYDIM